MKNEAERPMPYFTAAHLKVALGYLGEHVHPQLISLLAMFSSRIPISDDDHEARRYGAREENILLEKYFRPTGGPEEKPFYLPFQLKGPSRWRDHRYAARSLQRMRKDRHKAEQALRQRSQSNKYWSFRSTFASDLQEHGISIVGDIPVSIPMLSVWLYRNSEIADIGEATEHVIENFALREYGTVGPIFSDAVPPELAAIPLQDHPIGEAELLGILDQFASTSGDTDTDEDVDAEDVIEDDDPGRWDITAEELGTLGDLVGIEASALQALAALRAGVHVIFTGAPGTGKTSLAVLLCKQAGFPHWTVSATDQWTTFDTIGGYFPAVHKDGGGEQLDFMPGHVVDTIERQRCLIIDEINRADIDKAFGELFTLLSGQAVTLPFRRRGDEGTFRRVRLTHGPSLQEDDLLAVEVPSWWRIIGAMNDADKQSLKQLSYAFMRRFAFVAVPLPPKDAYEKLLRDKAEDNVPPEVVDSFVELFTDEESGFGEVGLPLGPAIPLSMLRHVSSRLAVDSSTSATVLMQEVLESYVMPQFQGRADLHQKLLQLLVPRIGSGAALFSRRLAVWTGYLAETDPEAE